jgi:hypothetical protein
MRRIAATDWHAWGDAAKRSAEELLAEPFMDGFARKTQ